MVISMHGLEIRDGIWKYRRAIPAQLRPAFGGAYNIIRSLGTRDRATALRRYDAVKAEVDRLFKEASGRQTATPAVQAYRAVQQWRIERAQHPAKTYSSDDDEEEGAENEEDALDHHLTMLLERNEQHGKPLDAAQRAIFEALLKRRSEEGGEDNPPLTILFERYYVERKLPVKTKTEWEGICTRFVESVGADLPVRSLTQAHIRNFKTGMLTNASKRTGQPVAPVTVKKVLSALRAVLAWGKAEGYLTANVADGITVVGTLKDREDGRQPYSAEDLAVLFSRDACLARSANEARKRRSADTWLPWLALYTGARLEELGQLRVTDVREEDGVLFLAIELGDGKRLKTRSSRRRIPVHPDLIRMGFLDLVAAQRTASQARLFPELTATRYGSVTAQWSKWWGRHARRLGISDRKKTFHSFRHLFKDAARAVMPEEHHDALTGHSNRSVGRSYGRGVPLKVLAEGMARVSFAVPL